VDALSDVLRVARLSGGVFMHAVFSDPWCVGARMSPDLCAPFLKRTTHLVPYHYVVEGELYAALEGGAPVSLQRGDLVLFPGNDVHVIGSDLSLPPVRANDIILSPDGGGLHAIRHGGGGAATVMICGYLGCETLANNPVLATLPRMLRLKVEEVGPAEWIRTTFHYAAGEVAAGRPGSDTILAKLSELLFVEAVRRYVEALPEGQIGWLGGLRDAAVARALALMHGEIGRNWSVDELGRSAGVSRSVLADKFVRLIGLAPMQYLAKWRMQVAAQSLKETNTALAQIANSVGYESEAAFSRAFKREFGTAPATWRRANSL
jgi:AraC-like DNA-binding protein